MTQSQVSKNSVLFDKAEPAISNAKGIRVPNTLFESDLTNLIHINDTKRHLGQFLVNGNSLSYNSKSTFKVRMDQFIDNIILVLKRPAIAAANIFVNKGWGYDAINQITVRIMGKIVMSYDGKSLCYTALASSKESGRGQDFIELGGEFAYYPDTSKNKIAYIPLLALGSLLATNDKPFYGNLGDMDIEVQYASRNAIFHGAGSETSTAFESAYITISAIQDVSSYGTNKIRDLYTGTPLTYSFPYVSQITGISASDMATTNNLVTLTKPAQGKVLQAVLLTFLKQNANTESSSGYNPRETLPVTNIELKDSNETILYIPNADYLLFNNYDGGNSLIFDTKVVSNPDSTIGYTVLDYKSALINFPVGIARFVENPNKICNTNSYINDLTLSFDIPTAYVKANQKAIVLCTYIYLNTGEFAVSGPKIGVTISQ